MLPGPFPADSGTGHHPFDRPASQPVQQSHAYDSSGSTPGRSLDLPKPLEPRPTHYLHPSLSDAPRVHGQDGGLPRPSASAIPDARGHGQNLPGLKDILTPPPPLVHPRYEQSWGPLGANVPPSHRQSVDGYSIPMPWHPPLALHPQTDVNPAYQQCSQRRLDFPVRESSPVSRVPQPSMPMSPYAACPDSYPERRRQPSSASYLANSSVASPFTSATPEDMQVKDHGAMYERSSDLGTAPPGAEGQRKYLGIREFVGEGIYHVYEGGYRIPTHVDGEQVNPQWGLTKANKPRKRLALACLDCREKKIKCEPGADSCLQCEKAKRPCRRTVSHQGQSEAPPAQTWPIKTSCSARKAASDQIPHNAPSDSESASKRRWREDPSSPGAVNKKPRSVSPVVNGNGPVISHLGNPPTAPMATTRMGEDRPNSRALEDDLPLADPDTVVYLLDLYFCYVNSATHCFFPRNAFMKWVRDRTDKLQDEQMVLSAMLAAGSLFANGGFAEVERRCVKYATEAVAAKLGTHSLLLVQTKLLLGLYHFARGSHGLAWEYNGSAIRSCSSRDLRLNREDERFDLKQSNQVRAPFALTAAQLAECRRRTFWSCFLVDRFEDGTLCALAPQDIFLRLPCTDEMYERSALSDAPFYYNGIIDPSKTILTPTSPVCPMGWLACVAARWGDVLNFTNRAIYRAHDNYQEVYKTFYDETETALQGWSSRLPDHLQYNHDNLARSIAEGYADVYVSMHALYLFTLIRLNRCIRHALMPDLVGRNIRQTYNHAHSLLAMMTKLIMTRREVTASSRDVRTDDGLSMPFLGFMVYSAIDVVGAGGLEPNLGNALDVMGAGLDCLRVLARVWETAKEYLKASEKRYYQIKNVLERPYKARSGAWLGPEWGMKDPLDNEFGLEYDCIYGLDHDGRGDGYSRTFFNALREDTHDGRPQTNGLRTL